MTFFLQKPSLTAIKSAVDDILSLVNDVLSLEKSTVNDIFPPETKFDRY